jgi:hypothetical protein
MLFLGPRLDGCPPRSIPAGGFSRITTPRMISNMPAATAAADVPKLLVQTPPIIAPTTKAPTTAPKRRVCSLAVGSRSAIHR